MTRLLIIFMLFSEYALSQVKGQSEKLKDIPIGNDQTDLNKSLSLTMKEVREGKAGLATLIFMNQGIQSGLFRFKGLDNRAVDDSSKIVKFQNRIYERVHDFVKPEYFGANPNDTLDDGPAIQKALNSETKKGSKYFFQKVLTIHQYN